MKYVAAALLATLVLAANPASAAVRTFTASMNGAQEVPPTATTGSGSCTGTLDDVSGAVTISCSFTGLTTNASNAHIHGLAGPGVSAGVIVPMSFPAAMSGIASGSGTLTPAQLAGMLAGQTYANIHSTMFPAGELRGQIAVAPAAVPAAGFWQLAILGAGLLAAGSLIVARRRAAAA